MPRQKNTKPTNIYWLYDVRPETIAGGWPTGKPFYCGKTIESPEQRLRSHRSHTKHYPERKVTARIVECGRFVHARMMEVVPSEEDWCARERYWIATMRRLYPGCCLNISDGGDGSPGWIPSAATRAKIGAANKGNRHTPEACAKISAAHRGRKQPADAIAKRLVTMRGRKRSPEWCANMSVVKRGTKHSPETRAKMSATHRGKPKSPEHIASLKKVWERRKAAASHVAMSPTS